MQARLLSPICACFCVLGDAHGGIDSFTTPAAWQTAINGSFSTLDFTDLPPDTFVTNQYESAGIVFNSICITRGPTPGFPNDQYGLFGPENMRFRFDSPQRWVAVDYPGGVQFQLFHEGTLVFTSPAFLPGGLGNFAGLVSDVPFDEVLLFKPPGLGTAIFIDDLHWGAPIPTPGGLLLLLGAAAHGRRRRSPMDGNPRAFVLIPRDVCPGDLVGSVVGVPDGRVDVNDLLFVISKWGTSDCVADIDNNATVNVSV